MIGVRKEWLLLKALKNRGKTVVGWIGAVYPQ
jgi:hypothetical protein